MSIKSYFVSLERKAYDSPIFKPIWFVLHFVVGALLLFAMIGTAYAVSDILYSDSDVLQSFADDLVIYVFIKFFLGVLTIGFTLLILSVSILLITLLIGEPFSNVKK